MKCSEIITPDQKMYIPVDNLFAAINLTWGYDCGAIDLVIDYDLMIDSQNINDILVVNIKGDIDAFTVQRVRNQLTQFIENGYRKIVVNLSQVRYINCISIGVLVSGLRELKKYHGELVLVELSDRVNQVLTLVGGKKLFKIFNTESEAIDTLAQSKQ